MYLENSEQCSPATVDEERSAKALLTEQYQIPPENVLEDLASPSKRSTKPIKDDFDDQIVLDGEIKTRISSSDSFSTDEEEAESSCCDGNFESFERSSAAGDGLCESHQIDQFETEGLSRPFDERAQHCECFEPHDSSAHCANHSLTSECGPCCEHCAEHLGSSQQCKPSNQQCDPEPEEVTACRCTFGRCEIPDFIYDEHSEELEAQQHEPLDQQDGVCDSEPEDCEQFETTATVSDSEDSSDCNAQLCEDDQMPYQSECSYGEGADPPEEHEAFEEESGSISPTHSDNPDHFYLDESLHVSIALECCDVYQENYQVVDTSSDHDEESETHSEIQPGYETTELSSSSERTSDFFYEEDGSSDCSSVETKSFKTCLGSIPSDPCSDSSEESDKGAQEDSGDEQMQWDSFEEDDDLQQIDTQELNEDRKKTPIVDIIIEDYFGLFDRDDYYGHAPKCHYVSCFDGGDIHARLYLEDINSKAQKVGKNTNECKEIDEDSCLHDTSDEAGEDTTDDHEESLREETLSESVSELEEQPGDWIIEPESSSAENEVESDEAEEEEIGVFCHCDLESCEHKTEDSEQSRGNWEKMCPPFVNDITVEGDAYEDEMSEPGYEPLCRNSSTFCGSQRAFPDSKSESTGDSEDNEFSVCIEMEPYWSLASQESVGLVEDPYVEEYYAYQIRSIETVIKPALGGFMKKDCSHYHIWEGKANEVCWSKTDDADLSPDDSESQAQLDGQQQQSSLELNNDCQGREPAEEKTLPSGIIHSVVSEEEGEDPEQCQEDEESDDESCDCEYCLPPEHQVCPCFCLLTCQCRAGLKRPLKDSKQLESKKSSLMQYFRLYCIYCIFFVCCVCPTYLQSVQYFVR